MGRDPEEELTRVLECLERQIDLEHLRKVEQLHLNAIQYREVPYLPLSVTFSLDETVLPFRYSEAFESPAKMLFNELNDNYFCSIHNSVRLRDHYPLHIRANYGIGVIASMLGARVIVPENGFPWVEPLGDVDEIKAVIAAGVPEFERGLGGRVLGTYLYFRDRMRDYPRCSEAIHLSQPDLQGPMDIAHLLVGSDVFLWCYDDPDLLCELLDLITDVYIGYRKHIDGLLSDRAGQDAVYVHGAIVGGQVIVKDDAAAVNLSPTMYERFSRPYNARILKAFGGGGIHYCGRSRTVELMDYPWLRGVDHGNPEMQQLKSTYDFWSRREVPVIRWGCGQGREFLEGVYKLGITTGMSLTVQAGSYAEALEIINVHVGRSRSQ